MISNEIAVKKLFADYVKEITPVPIKTEQSYTTARLSFENRQLSQIDLIENNIHQRIEAEKRRRSQDTQIHLALAQNIF